MAHQPQLLRTTIEEMTSEHSRDEEARHLSDQQTSSDDESRVVVAGDEEESSTTRRRDKRNAASSLPSLILSSSRELTCYTDAADTLKYPERIRSSHQNHTRRALYGALIGGLVACCMVAAIIAGGNSFPPDFSQTGLIRREYSPSWTTTESISYYLSLFQRGDFFFSETGNHLERRLADSSGSFRDAQLVIAGKMSVDDGPCNIAQFNLKSNRWSLSERIQLSLYNSYSGGEVYSLLANHTSSPPVVQDSDDPKR
jgi:hypothetical protein